MVLTYLKKRIKPDVPEAVIEAVRTVKERKYSTRVAASRYGITHTTLFLFLMAGMLIVYH